MDVSNSIYDISPKDIGSDKWIDDIREWPEIDYGDIYNYLICSEACDGEQMKNYKSFDSFNYFKSGGVGRIMHHVCGDGVILMKCDVRPSQRLNNENHHPWIVCSLNGTIRGGGCTCMAGSSKTCSHVGAMLWKIEYAGKRGLIGRSCTDFQAKWNQGTTRNIEPGPVAEMDFKKPKLNSPVTAEGNGRPDSACLEKSTFKSFACHTDLTDFVANSNLKPLFNVKNSILNTSITANIKEVVPVENPPHSAHNNELTCKKCERFYRRYVVLSPNQIQHLADKTVLQAQTELWHESRKVRITGSSASKVPVRETTNPDNFVQEHMYPTFRGNMYTKYGQDGEIKAKKQLGEDGHIISEVGTVVSETDPWLSVSPDGIFRASSGKELLEIKCPFLKDMTLDELLSSGKYDVARQSDTLVLKPSGQRGYFLQVQLTMHVMELSLCKFVVYSPEKYEIVSVPYDADFCERQISRLRAFYFSKFLPRAVDDFEAGRLTLSHQYAQLSK